MTGHPLRVRRNEFLRYDFIKANAINRPPVLHFKARLGFKSILVSSFCMENLDKIPKNRDFKNKVSLRNLKKLIKTWVEKLRIILDKKTLKDSGLD